MPLKMYEEMGKEHIKKDKELNNIEITRLQKEMNEYAMILLKILMQVRYVEKEMGKE